MSHGSIRLFTAILLLVVGWQAWRRHALPSALPVSPPVIESTTSEKPSPLFPDE